MRVRICLKEGESGNEQRAERESLAENVIQSVIKEREHGADRVHLWRVGQIKALPADGFFSNTNYSRSVKKQIEIKIKQHCHDIPLWNLG